MKIERLDSKSKLVGYTALVLSVFALASGYFLYSNFPQRERVFTQVGLLERIKTRYIGKGDYLHTIIIEDLEFKYSNSSKDMFDDLQVGDELELEYYTSKIDKDQYIVGAYYDNRQLISGVEEKEKLILNLILSFSISVGLFWFGIFELRGVRHA
ncbi:hypothetical protein ACJJIE_10780 [Microbulbifer sp. TRSA001]|uniref:hypothetical protein n=1 Tax=Microbulbifer sp. TRSA001 TaxID=3243381 RepID=UPI004039569E